MEKNLILNGNELIAEFMGFKVIAKSFEDKLIYNIPTNNGIGYISYMMEYHKSWDWLMPVVEKIEEMSVSVSISYNYCYIETEQQKGGFNKKIQSKNKLKSTYKAVVKFIKWNNKNKE